MLARDTYLSIVAMDASSLRQRINVMLIKAAEKVKDSIKIKEKFIKCK